MKKFLGILALTLVGLVVLGNNRASAIESRFHGQFRVNSYMQSQGEEETFGKEVRASRLRYRPTWDVKLDNDVQMHLQLNIGHIKENTSNARVDNGGGPAFGLRHAYVLTPLKKIAEGWSLIGGLVPVSDKFGDTLFSGDWDFNPLTYAVLGDVEGLKVRVGAAKLVEGSESNSGGMTRDKADDLSAYVLDVDKGKFGGSYYLVTSDDAFGAGNITQNYYGVRYSDEFDGIGVNAFLLGNSGTFTKGGPWPEPMMTSLTRALPERWPLPFLPAPLK